MFNKKIILILSIFIVSLLAVSVVSAADNATDDVVGMEETIDDIDKVLDKDTSDVISVNERDNVVNVENDSVISDGNENNVEEHSFGTFTELYNLIQNSSEETLELNKNFKFDSMYDADFKQGLLLELNIKQKIIDGKGHIIDGNAESKIFRIYKNGLTLKNFVFKNIYSSSSKTDAAIYWGSYNGLIENCTFTDISLKYGNGAVTSYNTNLMIKDCYFRNMHIKDSVLDMLGDSKISNCTFTNISSTNVVKSGGQFINCTFVNNSATQVYFSSSDSQLINCSFIDINSSNTIINVRSSANNVEVKGCSFLNLESDIIIYIGGAECSISNCTFLNKTTGSNAICVFYGGVDSIVSDCHFVNIYGDQSTILWDASDGQLLNSIFINNTSKYTEGNSINWVGENGLIKYCYFDPSYKAIVCKNDTILVRTDSKIEGNNISFNYGENNSFTVCLKDKNENVLIDKEIIFKNNNESVTYSSFTDEKGNAIIPVGLANSAGNYTISILFEGDGNYNPSQSKININIKPSYSQLTIKNFNGTVDYNLTLTANVISSNNLTIDEGIVIFFNGEIEIGSANVINGIANLIYTPTTAGKSIITAIYNSPNYLSSNNASELSVAKANTFLNIEKVDSVYFSNPSNFEIKINSNNKPVNEGNIKFYINNVLVKTESVYNGAVNINYIANTTGLFTLNVVYDETENYFASNNTNYFYVDKMPTTLFAETTFFDEEQSKIFTINLKDNNGNGVNNQSVKIEVVKFSGESKTFVNVTNENGIVVFDVKNLTGGMWIVRGIFNENNNYIGSMVTDKFIVIRMDTTTSIDEIMDSHKGYPIRLHANILDEFGQKVTDGFAYYYVDGKKIGYVDLSNNNAYLYQAVYEPVLSVSSYNSNEILGACIFDSENMLGAYIPETEEILSVIVDNSNGYVEYIPIEGTYTLSVVYEGTSLYRPSNQTSTFDVQEGAVPTKLTATTITTVYNGGKYLVATLKDSWGNPISGVKVSIKINSVKTLTTDKNGQVKLSTNGLAPKAYTATITFAGNTNYDKSTGSAKVTVKKATPKLTAKAKTFKRTLKTKNYAIALKTDQNKVMKNTVVYLKVNKKTYAAKTNSKGVATFKITKLTKKGRYTAIVTYKGNAYYNKLTKKVIIGVK